jgi:hypothetical protein
MLAGENGADLGQLPALSVFEVTERARNSRNNPDALLPTGKTVTVCCDATRQLTAELDATPPGRSHGTGQWQFDELRRVLCKDSASVERVIRAFVFLRRTRPRRKRMAEVLG